MSRPRSAPVAVDVALALAIAIAPGCAEDASTTTVLVTLRAADVASIPEHAVLRWFLVPGVPGSETRVPRQGSFAPDRLELATVLVQLSDNKPGEREVVAEGVRGNRTVASTRARVPWMRGVQQQLTLVLAADGVIPDPPPTLADAGPSTSAGDAGVAQPQDVAGSPVDGRAPPPPPPPDASVSDPRDGPAASPDLPRDPAADPTPAGRPPSAFASGLLLHWTFDEAAGPIASDVSGNGLHGRHVGAGGPPQPSPQVPGVAFPNPRSLAFERSKRQGVALATMPAALKGQSISISVWFRATSVDTTVAADTGSDLVNAGNSYVLRIDSNRIEASKRLSGGSWAVCPAPSSRHLDGNWHHVGASISATNMQIQIDGGTSTTCGRSGALTYDLGNDLLVGRNAQTETHLFEGHIDEVRIWNRALGFADFTALARGAP